MKKYFFIAAACGLFILGGCSFPTSGTVDATQEKGPTVILNTQKGRTEISVDISDTTDERTRGLMNRKSIPEDYGMFFIFDVEEPLSFWMKNTLVPLDMIFFDRDYKVVKIVKNAQPCRKDPCDVFPSDKPAKYVLEVNGGTGDNIGLKEGDKAELKI